MKILGIRCSNSDYAYAVLTGTKKSPELVASDIISFPKGYSPPEIMKWLLQELESINTKNEISKWVIKGAEPMALRDKAYTSRVEFEAMVSLSAINNGSSNVIRKVKPTIAKDLGLKGTAKALVNDLDYSLIDGLKMMVDKEFESVVAAWSELE